MFLCVLFLYAFLMAAWPIIVVAGRAPVRAATIIILALLFPIIFVAMEFLMGIAGGGDSDENFHGIAEFMPTVGLAIYVAGSIGVVIWAHRAMPKVERRGFPVIRSEPLPRDEIKPD